jgi:hypothetical protein
LVPLLPPSQSKYASAEKSDAPFPGWPNSFEGRELTPLPLSEREQRFGRDFPGRLARFTDGKREIIIRWVTQPTRKLHPASDCFEGIGYGVRPGALRLDRDGARWGSFIATRGTERLLVSERIYTDAGDSWSDASAWYWSAIGQNSPGPWWAITVAERIGESNYQGLSGSDRSAPPQVSGGYPMSKDPPAT